MHIQTERCLNKKKRINIKIRLSVVTYVFTASTQGAGVDGSLSSMLKTEQETKAPVKNTGCYYGGTRFDSQHPYRGSQLYVTTFPGSVMPCGTSCTSGSKIHMQTENTDAKKKIKVFLRY